MQRPRGITITAIFMALNVCIDVSHVLIPSAKPAHTHALGPVSPNVVIAIHIALAGFVALEFITVLFYWLGHGWARWFVLAGCIYYITGLKDLPFLWSHSRFIAGVTLLDAVLAVFLLWYLHWRDIRIWFHERSTQQAIA